MSMHRVVFGVVVLAVVAASAPLQAADWPRFRGPNGTGIADDKTIPAKWTAKNMLWTTEVPGKGHSSPIISKGKVFLQSASNDSKERYLVCVDAASGTIDWSKNVPGNPAKTHPKNSLSSCTPAADGERVYAIFWDGSDLLLTAYDFEGNQKWKQDLGSFASQHGAGMSPMLVGDKVIVNKDQDGAAELLAFDAKSGNPVWKKKRDPERACYSTPFLLEKTDAGPELLVVSTGGVTAYDPKDGSEIWNLVWKFDNMRLRTVASPIEHQGMIFAVAGDGSGERNMIAVKAGGNGDVTSKNLVWQKKKYTPYVPTPLAKDGMLFWVTDKENVAFCVDAKSGNEIWKERLGGGGDVSASPVMIDGKIFVINENGTVFVFAAAKTFDLLGKNELKERVFASPAVANGRLYVRGAKHLFCIGTK